ncbi:glucan 1,4-alpha-glucosidase [Natronolimnobius sp. AArcel1]|uniref:glycoside hydrolase family 15 protein n=1 Tax=Natronolimnobius sp. AArcel1 TaxID=1679093 RepID=UPI0013EC0225|nr:glycoside hydrolase family 15 protein [Natronolimnobius sp. AArcel1]NGM69571.1 glucan 1,4-alpha-glucosidase [Natronolimnobius sp. AArcel1]
MTLHSALNDAKRTRADDTGRQFPGERRSTTGLFSGLDDRLVHVTPDGSSSDYSYSLCGLVGLERSRFGLVDDGDVQWFEDGTQRYVGASAVVETVHDLEDVTITQYDLTVGTVHLTHFELTDGGETLSEPTIRACLAFAPEGRVGQTGQLRHDDAIEIYHDRERNYVAASSDLEISGQVPADFETLLEPEPVEFPRNDDGDGRYEETRLSPIVLADADLAGSTPSTTIATLLTDSRARTGDRLEALERIRAAVSQYATSESLLEAGRVQAREHTPDLTALEDDNDIDGALADLRVLSLLRASNGARIAGPEFDPFFRYSGGYGYTWFRDDAEIASFLLEADQRVDLGLEQWHRQSAQFYAETQLPDGTWPHRVWPRSGDIAPGWANGRLETGTDDADYQADQTASVATYLAQYLQSVDSNSAAVENALLGALEGLDDTLEQDGLPERVQNAWENMTGLFTHTVATYLEAYATIAQAPIDPEKRQHAAERAQTVYRALDLLWTPDRGCYALRLADGELDDRLDGSTFALASAHAAYAALPETTLSAERIDRLVSHFETTLEGLYRDPSGPIEGIARFEDDPWRVQDQDDPKVWTVTTAWGAHAAAELSELLDAHTHDAASTFDQRARDLLALVDPNGTLRSDGNYLPEQFFDDGTPDSATPLGWPHALRLVTAVTLEEPSQSQTEPPLTR